MIARRTLVLALLAAVAGWGQSRWIKISAAHFEIYTNAGERTGRAALERFEQIRQIFHDASRNWGSSPLPVRVFLFANEADFRPYQPAANVPGHFLSGPERDYIAMHAATSEAYRVMFHEYVHTVLNHVSGRLPQWLEEGTAEFYSTLEASGERVRIGKAVPSHERVLALEPWIGLRVLLSIDKASPHYSAANKAGVFYAQSWALVHMLNLSSRYRDGLIRLAEVLEAGGTLEEAYGRPLDEIERDLRAYVRHGAFPTVEVGFRSEARAPDRPAQALAAPEIDLVLGDLSLRMGRAAEAGKLFARVVAGSPDSISGQTGLGALALSRGDFDQARKHLGRAIALGSREPETYFEHAMLLRETKAPREQVIAGLRRTVELNPNFAEAHFLLGTMIAADGRHSEALPHLRQAAEILPRQSYFWHALALAHHELGQGEPARRAANRALRAAVTGEELGMAEAALRLAASNRPATAAKRPEVVTPESWKNRRGDSTVAGTLRRIECLGSSARLHIDAQPKPVVLLVRDPSKVEMRNLSAVSFEFQCGAQARAVIVEFIRMADGAGEVTAIEFPR